MMFLYHAIFYKKTPQQLCYGVFVLILAKAV